MSELLKQITVKVVGVSFDNDDGSSRQENISVLGVGEALLLKFFEYNNEPAYAVTDALGNQIGNLPKELSKELYDKYKDCYFVSQVDDILGGDDGLKYGCVISVSVYDYAPEIFSPNRTPSPSPAPVEKEYSDRTYSVSGIILIVLGVILALIGLLLLIVFPIVGVAAILGGVLSFVIGRKYRKTAKEHSKNKN